MKKSLVVYFALVLVLGPSVGRADPPFGKKPAYIEPLSPNPISCQVTDTTCLRVATFVLKNIVPWITDPGLVSEINRQNKQNAHLTNLDIDKLDIAWVERTNILDPLAHEGRASPAGCALKVDSDVVARAG